MFSNCCFNRISAAQVLSRNFMWIFHNRFTGYCTYITRWLLNLSHHRKFMRRGSCLHVWRLGGCLWNCDLLRSPLAETSLKKEISTILWGTIQIFSSPGIGWRTIDMRSFLIWVAIPGSFRVVWSRWSFCWRRISSLSRAKTFSKDIFMSINSLLERVMSLSLFGQWGSHLILSIGM